MNAQLETILRRYLVLVPERQDLPLETELPALGLDSMRLLLSFSNWRRYSTFRSPILCSMLRHSARPRALRMLSRCYGKNGMATSQDTEEFMGGRIP